MTESLATIVVTGLGMVSSLGLNAATSCAAARAGLTRTQGLNTFSIYSETEWADVPVSGHIVPQYAEGFEGFGKLFRLGSGAFEDLLSYEGVRQIDFSRVAIIINLSSYYFTRLYQALEPEASLDGFSMTDLEELENLIKTTLIPKILSANNIEIPVDNQVIIYGDQSGTAEAISEASKALNSDQIDYCIVGGIDSYVEENILTAATYFNLVKVEGLSVGFQPGEAAAFVLLERQDFAKNRSVKIEAVIEGSMNGQESCHRLSEDGLSLGNVLSECITGTLDDLVVKDIKPGLVIGNLNGDSYRANEWGHALVQLGVRYPFIGELPHWYPSQSYGETGAAAGAVAICMAVRAFSRNYAQSNQILVWLSSDTGSTGSFCLRKFTH